MLQGWAWPSGEIILYLPSHRVPRANSKPRSSYLTSEPPCLCMSPNAHTHTHPTSPVHPQGNPKHVIYWLPVAGKSLGKNLIGIRKRRDTKRKRACKPQPELTLGHQKGAWGKYPLALRNHTHTVNVSSVVLRDLPSGSLVVVRALWALHESEVSLGATRARRASWARNEQDSSTRQLGKASSCSLTQLIRVFSSLCVHRKELAATDLLACWKLHLWHV